MKAWAEYQLDFLANDTSPQEPIPEWLTLPALADVPAFHATVPQYAETPLLSLSALAKAGGVAGFYVKNEAERFGLNAFKALGSSYAISKILSAALGQNLLPAGFTGLQQPQTKAKTAAHVFATATDGNHGRGVAWTAKQLGLKAHIYMPAGTEPERVQAIRDFGAEVTVTDVSYDETVALARAQAQQNGWTLVQDTAFPGYTDIPKLIIQGYATMAEEIVHRLPPDTPPTHIFLQAGVGSMAGGVLAVLKQHFPAAHFIIIEPKNVACCLKAAAEKNDAASVGGIQKTIMAGLNCGTPCPLIMPLLRAHASFFVGCPDFVAAHGMRLAQNPTQTDPQYISGESGAVGPGLASLLLSDKLPQSRSLLGINSSSVLLAINTEGAMAPAVWHSIVKKGALPLPKEAN